MEPIRINVTLDFSERAAALIQQLTGAKVPSAPAPTVPSVPRPETRPMAQPSAAESGNAPAQPAPAPAKPQAEQRQPVAPSTPAAGGKR